MIPLYGFLEGDTLGLLVLAEADDTMATIADKLQRSAGVRVRPRKHLRVRLGDRVLEPTITVAAAGLAPLDRIDVIPGDGEGE